MSVIFWIAAAACVIAEIAILRFTFAVHRANKSALVPVASRTGELVWAFIPALALLALFVATWQRIEARHSHMMNHGAMPMATASADAAER